MKKPLSPKKQNAIDCYNELQSRARTIEEQQARLDAIAAIASSSHEPPWLQVPTLAEAEVDAYVAEMKRRDAFDAAIVAAAEALADAPGSLVDDAVYAVMKAVRAKRAAMKEKAGG